MNYFKLAIALIFVFCVSEPLSAQTLTSTPDKEDQIKVYNSKNALLTKVKANIERKRNLENDDDDDRDDDRDKPRVEKSKTLIDRPERIKPKLKSKSRKDY